MKLYLVLLLTGLSCLSAKVLANNNFAEDLDYIQQFDSPIILKSKDQQSQLVLSAQHQGRVLTSTATGVKGLSNAWLDKKALQNKTGNVGGEDRTWIAPIGSKFSLFYPAGKEIKSENWQVPTALNEKNYSVVLANNKTVHFQKNLQLINHQNSQFSVQLDRKITLLNKPEIEQHLNIQLPKAVNQVAYSSDTELTNLGDNWHVDKGLITLWSMAMLQGSDDNISMFTITPEQAPAQSYLYDLYGDRLISKEHLIFYKTDGKYRSKIGIPVAISGNLILSYSPSLKRLTVIKFTLNKQAAYPISLEQENTNGIKGDVTNAYNHGNMDGSLLANSAFFELESSAPMRALKTNESVSHTQQVFHFVGQVHLLDLIAKQLVGIKVSETDNIFQSQ
ncbi:DUF6786 family protein [Paraglaciecola sp. L3A3]|uniref:DUF6786 family protein n=1 Tax=Paraglaciecola sp. L3A3 TaxID=2686358 RepID=UPI00131DCEA6|nr:DUF6786 family protein [Paraglaciecola sp. L3A3]